MVLFKAGHSWVPSSFYPTLPSLKNRFPILTVTQWYSSDNTYLLRIIIMLFGAANCMDNKRIEKIQQRIDELSEKQVQLAKANEQRWFLYRWFQQPDPEIAHLRAKELEFIKLLHLQASTSVQHFEKDWSNTPLFWKRLSNLDLSRQQTNSTFTFIFWAGLQDLHILLEAFIGLIIF
jgi:hypothetical protein